MLGSNINSIVGIENALTEASKDLQTGVFFEGLDYESNQVHSNGHSSYPLVPKWRLMVFIASSVPCPID